MHTLFGLRYRGCGLALVQVSRQEDRNRQCGKSRDYDECDRSAREFGISDGSAKPYDDGEYEIAQAVHDQRWPERLG